MITIRSCHTAVILSRETKKALFYHAKPQPHGFHKYVDIWDPSVAKEIMVAIQQVFSDTNYEDNFSEEEDSNFFSFVFWGS